MAKPEGDIPPHAFRRLRGRRIRALRPPPQHRATPSAGARNRARAPPHLHGTHPDPGDLAVGSAPPPLARAERQGFALFKLHGHALPSPFSHLEDRPTGRSFPPRRPGRTPRPTAARSCSPTTAWSSDSSKRAALPAAPRGQHRRRRFVVLAVDNPPRSPSPNSPAASRRPSAQAPTTVCAAYASVSSTSHPPPALKLPDGRSCRAARKPLVQWT